MTGRTMNKKLGLWHFWTMFVFFNLTFFPMFIIGLLGQPRRVFTYARDLQTLKRLLLDRGFLSRGLLPHLRGEPDVVPVHRTRKSPRPIRGTHSVSNGRPPHRFRPTTSSGFRSS